MGEEREKNDRDEKKIGKKKPKVLWLMQYAPHYRESLLRTLGENCNLTVSATPCRDHKLIEPEERKGYRYYEGRGLPFFWKLGFQWLTWEYRLVRKNRWDLIFCVEDMHYPLRYILYIIWLFSRRDGPKWVWWGHFFGRKNWAVLNYIRRFLINSSNGALTYTEEVRKRLIDLGCHPGKIISSNNSDVSEREIHPLPFPPIDTRLNVLFVGRLLKQKQIERLINLLERMSFVYVRLIGPGMESLRGVIERRGLAGRVSISEAKTGENLYEDFLWCHLVANPGPLGLLVISAAKHGRAIVVDNQSRHGPEALIAKEAGQPFISWGNERDVDGFFRKAYAGELPLKDWGLTLAEYVRTHYTIEHSIDHFTSFF